MYSYIQKYLNNDDLSTIIKKSEIMPVIKSILFLMHLKDDIYLFNDNLMFFI
jgi:hypothetical protein